MSSQQKMKCNICGKIVGIRKSSNSFIFPVYHFNSQSKQPCHGFYEEGFIVKEEVE